MFSHQLIAQWHPNPTYPGVELGPIFICPVASPPHLVTKPNQSKLNSTQLKALLNQNLNQIKTSIKSKPVPNQNLNQNQTKLDQT